MPQSRFGGLWRHRDFRLLWAAQTASQSGSQISMLALPLLAVLVLDASPAQMGVLTACGSASALLLGLFAGVWVDRRRRRPILIAADIGRAVLLATLPVAALLNLLRIEHLFVVAFLVGTLSLFFDVAYRSFLPSLIRRDQLVEGNSKLELSRSAAEIAGPGLAGGLVQLVAAPFAIAFTAMSYLFSALFLRRMQAHEPPPVTLDRPCVRAEIGEGIRLVTGTPILRALAGGRGTVSLFNGMLEAVFFLYVARVLGLEPLLLGIIFAAGSVGFLIGAILPEPTSRRFGVGSTTMGALLLVGFSDLIVPLAAGPVILIVGMLMAAQFLFGLGLTVYNVNEVSLRQLITPDRLQGRMNATMRFIAWSAAPVGALLGGACGELIGLRPTLIIAALGEMLAVLWLALSPVRALQRMPTQVEHPSAAVPD